MRKHLAVVVALAMVLTMLVPFLPGGVALADSTPGVVTRRALIIGNANYAYSPLTGPVYDVRHMEALFKQMDFGTEGSPAENGAMSSGDIKKLTDQTKSQIRNDIINCLKNKADDDDVSYFYYSGHGSVSGGEAQIVGVDMNMISLTELKTWLDEVPGTKVVILDSCFSGGFIDKSTSTASTTKSSSTKSSVTVLSGHNRKGAVVTPRSVGLKKFAKPGVSDAGLFPMALKQKPPAKQEELSQQFNSSVSNAFSRTSKYIDSGKYIVLTAATQDEYSYEFGFNTIYGPNFRMYDPATDTYENMSDRETNDSGEFTGMLIAGAGKVTFDIDLGEIGLLADYNSDNKVTAEELDHYFKGSMICSDVGVFVSSQDENGDPLSLNTAIFSHATPEANAPRVRLSGYTDIPESVKTGAEDTNIPITLNLSGLSGAMSKKLVVYRYPKVTDGLAINGETLENAVRTLDTTNPAAVSWDGKDDKGHAVANGIYKIVLEYGEGMAQESDVPYLYPGVTVVLERGLSDLNDANKVTLGSDGASFTSPSDDNTISIVSDGVPVSKWFEANVTGAMNVYADGKALAKTQSLFCELHDAEGNTVNYQESSPITKQLYMPFYAKAGEKFELVFGIDDSTGKGAGTGTFGYRLRLNPTISVGENVSGAGLDYEAWYVQPGESLPGNYVIQSYGDDNTAATVVDRNQVAAIGLSDDYYDKHFLISAPLVKDAGYLIVTRDYNAGPDSSFTFRVNAPGSLSAFSAPEGTQEITDDGSGYFAIAASQTGEPTYFKIHTGSNREKWTFVTSASSDDSSNDPNLMLMDNDPDDSTKRYNLIAANDDYNGWYDPEMAAVLEPDTDYVLSCYGYGMQPYSCYVLAFKQELTADSYVVTMPKTVFMDNTALSLDRFGTVSGWGYNGYGEAGVGTMGPLAAPATVILPGLIPAPALDIWAGSAAGFARLKDDEYCWWGMPFGVTEDDESDFEYEEEYTAAPQMIYCLEGMDVADIKCGAGDYALVRTFTGEIYLLDVINDTLTPVSLAAVDEDSHSVAQIAVTDSSYFALCKDGKLFAWGDNWDGECGVGYVGSVTAPTQVNFGDGVAIKQIAAGWYHVLALASDGSVFAWGDNGQDQLGLGAKADAAYKKPQMIDGSNFAGHTVASVAAGASHSIAVDSSGNVYGWGANTYGDFGLGSAYDEAGTGNASRIPSPLKLPFYSDLGAAHTLMQMSAGMMAVFAQDYAQDPDPLKCHYRIYGYGGNLDGQLGYIGQSPEEGAYGTPTLLMTLLGPAEHSSALKALHANADSVEINHDDNTITVSIPAGDDASEAICVLQPEAVDYEATYTINSEAVSWKAVSIAHPGESATVTIDVSHPGLGTTQYTVTVKRAVSRNVYLKGFTLTSGVRLSPAVSAGATNYTITLPERMSNVAITAQLAGYGASYTVNPAPGKDGTYSVGLNGSTFIIMKVKSQAGNTQIYYLTIKRPYQLSSLSAAPIYSGYPSLSPGGTNTMKIRFALVFASGVKIEVKKGSTWYVLKTLTSSQVVVGANTWAWNGKIGSSTLAAGTYSIRVTPTGCTAKTLTVKILNKPVVTVPTLTPTTLKANGANKLKFSVKWTVISNVKVEIVNSAGTVVYTALSGTDLAPTTKTLYWNGKKTSGSLVPAGTYRVKVTAGATVYYKTFKVTR